MRGKLLAATVAAVALTGCGASTKTVTNYQSTTLTVTSTVPTPPTKTVTVTSTASQTAATAPATSSSTSASGSGQSYSGNGGKNLGTITVANDSTVNWSNDGDLFQILDGGAFVINSQAHSGTSALPAGTYHNVIVNAAGNWTMNITPG